MLDVKSQLNKSQAEAAIHVKGPLLVIAGAGSGKTRVITYRIANLVINHGVDPRRIMAVTFTNKAAKEMQERIQAIIGRGAACWISTFHASCARLLRTYGEMASVDTNFTIYDDSDQKAMVTRCLKEMNLSDKQFPPRSIQNEINKAKRELISPDKFPVDYFYQERIREIYTLYEKRMKQAKALDFGDLMYRTVTAMQNNPQLAKVVSDLFDYVLVDEFQDTNKVQLELVRLLTPHRNICVVGDDDQSIYSWRGADVTNILDFEKFFSGAKIVTLDRNYRSTANILNASNQVVNKLTGRREKKLWTQNHEGEKIGYVRASDEREEALLVARAIRDMQEDNHPLSEQAVFYRTNAQSRVLEEVMRSMNIPHRVVGGMRFYERAEVKDIIAYMRLAQNPSDHAAFVRIINTPTRGIGKTTVEKLVAIAAQEGTSAFEAIEKAAVHGLPTAAVKKLCVFKSMVDEFVGALEEGPLRLAQKILDETGYLKRLEKENNAESDARIENIKELVGSIEDFEKDAENPTLDNFLELITLQSDVDQANFDGEQVTLMTVHAAKGLEFDIVFVTGMEDGIFPFRRSDDSLTGEAFAAMEEERRLGYVAMTRARKRLFLTRAITRRLFGNAKQNPPSRFLSEIPQDIVEDLSPQTIKVGVLGSRQARPQPLRGRASAPLRGRPSTPTGQPRSRPSSLTSKAASSGAQRRPAGAPPWLTKLERPTKPNKKKSSDTWIDTSFDQSAEPQLSPGQEVRHPRFGVGIVKAFHAGEKPKVDVQFPAFGRKTILLQFLELG